MSPREGTSRPKFGRIDPFCLLAVLPVLFVAGVLGALVNVLLGLGFAAVAGLILLFDSWANRPGPVPPARPARVQRPAPARAPARMPRPSGPRPPVRAPIRRAGPPPATR